MANIWAKVISILAGNLNYGFSYLIKTVPFRDRMFFILTCEECIENGHSKLETTMKIKKTISSFVYMIFHIPKWLRNTWLVPKHSTLQQKETRWQRLNFTWHGIWPNFLASIEVFAVLHSVRVGINVTWNMEFLIGKWNICKCEIQQTWLILLYNEAQLISTNLE